MILQKYRHAYYIRGERVQRGERFPKKKAHFSGGDSEIQKKRAAFVLRTTCTVLTVDI